MYHGILYKLILTSLAILTLGCETKSPFKNRGIQDPYIAYVPARIGVLPCRLWPVPARFAHLPLNIADENLITSICEKFDTFVVDGFKEQPFMRGYSPKAMEKLLQLADSQDFLTQLDAKWVKKPDDCIKCQSEGEYYTKSIMDRPEWRLWLADLSNKTRHIDAVLVPFFIYAAETVHDDRGLVRYERAIRLAILLVDTNNGGLIWHNYRVGRASKQKLIDRSQKEALSPPEWTTTLEKTLVDDFWDEFPGRQYN